MPDPVDLSLLRTHCCKAPNGRFHRMDDYPEEVWKDGAFYCTVLGPDGEDLPAGGGLAGALVYILNKTQEPNDVQT